MELHIKEERCLRALGVDVENELFLKDYAGFRKDHLAIVGQGALASQILLILSERWRKGEYRSPSPPAPKKKATKKKPPTLAST